MDDTYYTEYRYQQQAAMDKALEVIPQVDDEFGQIFDRRYGGLLSAEMMDGAQVAILTLGSLVSTARSVVNYLRKEKGIPVGLIKLRSVRPFPDKLLKECLSGLKAVTVLERDVSIGAGGIIFTELTRCLYNARQPGPLLTNYIMGLGGRDLTFDEVLSIAKDIYEERNNETITNPIRWWNVRGLS